ncbi:hypothetical protein D3C73_1409150 [compost metagenome]
MFDRFLRLGIAVNQQLPQQVIVTGILGQPFHVTQIENAQMSRPHLVQQVFNFMLITVDRVVADTD